MKEINARRTRNRAEQTRRHTETVLKIPALTEVESGLMRQGTRLLRCVLEKRDDFEDAKAAIQRLQAEKVRLLEENGLPADWLDDIYDCPACRDTGFDSEGHRCSCLKQLTLKYIGQNANLTETMKTQTFENFDFTLYANQPEINGKSPLKVIQAAADIASQFAEGFEQTHDNLLLMGGAGSGKTYLSSCIANRALERGRTVYYQNSYKLFTMLEGVRFGKAGEDLTAFSDYLYQAELLIIDDLGTEFLTQFTAAALFDLVSTRLNEKKSTIISTNLSFPDMERMYAQRTTSRLLGEYRQVNLLSRDLRLKRYEGQQEK